METQWYVEDQQAYEEHVDLITKTRRARRKMDSVLKALAVTFKQEAFSDWQPVKCPFHGDRRASASVNLHKNFFRCHACDVSGDPVRMMKMGRSWTEERAVEWILNST